MLKVKINGGYSINSTLGQKPEVGGLVCFNNIKVDNSVM